MLRTVRAFLPVAGDAAGIERAFAGDPRRWLPDACREGPTGLRMQVHAGAFSRHVSAAVGAPWRSGATQWRSLSWDPLDDDRELLTVDRMLPSLDAELGLSRGHDDELTLVLDGRYAPPGGAVGAAVDAVALHRIARSTGSRLLTEIASGLVREGSVIARTP
ncbi:MAG: hypothetical protein WDZ26_03200 [Nitriliruptoraceae bacterium]